MSRDLLQCCHTIFPPLYFTWWNRERKQSSEVILASVFSVEFYSSTITPSLAIFNISGVEEHLTKFHHPKSMECQSDNEKRPLDVCLRDSRSASGTDDWSRTSLSRWTAMSDDSSSLHHLSLNSPYVLVYNHASVWMCSRGLPSLSLIVGRKPSAMEQHDARR